MEGLNVGKKAKQRFIATGKKLLFFLCFLGLWQLIVVVFQIKVFILPSPVAVFKALLDPVTNGGTISSPPAGDSPGVSGDRGCWDWGFRS